MLDNLQTGDLVKTNRGTYGLVMDTHIIWNAFTTDIKSYYTDDLIHIGCDGLSIVAVYRENEKGSYDIFDLMDLMVDSGDSILRKCSLIWSKKDRINWSSIEKWTKVQVRDLEDEEWLNRYLIEYNPSDSHPFYVSSRSKYALGKLADSYTGMGFRMCRLYKEDK